MLDGAEVVLLYEGAILDGRNRYRACQAAGVDCRMEEYRGADPLAFVVSKNLKRRHLSESQRAMVAAKIANLGHGVRSDRAANLPLLDRFDPPAVTVEAASNLLNVSERTVRSARSVRDHGAPELVEAVERGTVSVSAAADVATRPAEEQRQIVARGEREILEAKRDGPAEDEKPRQIDAVSVGGRGNKGTASKIAEETGLSVRTVQRVLAEPKPPRPGRQARCTKPSPKRCCWHDQSKRGVNTIAFPSEAQGEQKRGEIAL